MGPDPGNCGRIPGGYTMVAIPCVLQFLGSRGQLYAGSALSDQSERAKGGNQKFAIEKNGKS